MDSFDNDTWSRFAARFQAIDKQLPAPRPFVRRQSPSARRPLLRGLGVGGFALLVWLVAGTLSAAASDARLRACGLDPSVQPRAQFQLTHGSDYRAHLPNVPDLPELSGEARSAWVIVVDGPISLPHTGTTGGDIGPVNSVTCVIVDGTPTVYTDLDLGGLTP